jgi:iron complex transport system substrate-binding protein
MTDSPRIVSLLSAATEMVCALGRGDHLVGISHECDYPPEILDRPVVTETKVHPLGTSRDIDSEVRRLVQEGLSVYRIRTDVLQQLKPDVILTQQQCQVCAVSYSDVLEAVNTFLEHEPKVVSLEPMRLTDILDDITRVGQAIGAEAQATELVQHLRERIDHVAQATREADTRPRVLCIEWLEPLMVAGNWMPEMVELAGGVNLLGKAGAHAPPVQWQEVLASAPEVIIIAPCGFSPERTRRELHWLTVRPEWAELPAVQAGRVYVADGVAYFNRSGPRIVDSLEMLAAMIDPPLGGPLLPPECRAGFRSLANFD